MTEAETFAARAAQALDEANAATLDNVRDRCMRAHKAWATMAERSARITEARHERETRTADTQLA
jgi:hypothetical protein